jgi:hypothetical protein
LTLQKTRPFVPDPRNPCHLRETIESDARHNMYGKCHSRAGGGTPALPGWIVSDDPHVILMSRAMRKSDGEDVHQIQAEFGEHP